MAIGQRVRRYREALDMSQGELGEWAELSQARISAIERGAAGMRVSELLQVAVALRRR